MSLFKLFGADAAFAEEAPTLTQKLYAYVECINPYAPIHVAPEGGARSRHVFDMTIGAACFALRFTPRLIGDASLAHVFDMT